MVKRTVLAILLGTLLCGTAAPEEAPSMQEVGRLREDVAAQRALIQELLQRLDAQQSVIEQLSQNLWAFERTRSVSLAQVAGNPQRFEGEVGLLDEATSSIGEIRDTFDAYEPSMDILPALGGYFDFEYFNDDRSDSPGEFRQHHVSLHVSKEYDDFRVFTEVEFEFGARFEGSGGTNVDKARGEIKLEHAWGEYVHSDLLILRGGLILSPGYWNVNHYPNVVLPTRRPLMVRKVFPESFAGVMGYGTKYWGGFGLTYSGYLGNGEGEFFTKEDDNDGKAYGGRASFHLPVRMGFSRFDVGISGYAEEPTGVEATRIWGLDAQMRNGRYELLSEFATRNAAEDRSGFYVQPSVRFGERWAAFYRYDQIDFDSSGRTEGSTLGLNFRPMPLVSLKLEYFHSNHAVTEDFNGLATSLAVAF